MFSLINALLLTVISFECLRVLQSANYKPHRGYFKVFLTWYYLCLIVLQIGFLVLKRLLPNYFCSILLCIFALLTLCVKRKCPLKITKRVLRIIIVEVVALFLLDFLLQLDYLVCLMPFITLFCFVICLPMDNFIAKKYLNKASTKLAQSNVKVIAVTGSYGKTSVKDMLHTLLCDSIAPSGSCNTPLGIAKFINGTNIDNYKYLILEFGARKIGDIAQLCGVYPPDFGVVTGVCPQHLATFKSFQNIVKTKGELPQSLPANGFCIFNGTDENIHLLQQFGSCKKISTLDCNVQNVESSLNGTCFELLDEGMSYKVCLPQISNYVTDIFLMCYLVCKQCGQSTKQTVERCKFVKQIPHRMEISYNGRFFIIDDAYNGNVKGVQSCCDSVKKLSNYKVVITQGIVEGGKDQQQLNVKCGSALGQVFDVVIATGKYKKYILEGASRHNCKVLCAKNLKEATTLCVNYLQPNCILLFQNDLPDVVNL